VLTKLDIMDRGTDAVAVLKNEAVPLALGFVGVVLRSQEDIANRRTMGDARGAERAFFEAHPEYLEVAPQVGGWVGWVVLSGGMYCCGWG
jgi:dynamin 1-like protein